MASAHEGQEMDKSFQRAFGTVVSSSSSSSDCCIAQIANSHRASLDWHGVAPRSLWLGRPSPGHWHPSAAPDHTRPARGCQKAPTQTSQSGGNSLLRCPSEMRAGRRRPDNHQQGLGSAHADIEQLLTACQIDRIQAPEDDDRRLKPFEALNRVD